MNIDKQFVPSFVIRIILFTIIAHTTIIVTSCTACKTLLQNNVSLKRVESLSIHYIMHPLIKRIEKHVQKGIECRNGVIVSGPMIQVFRLIPCYHSLVDSQMMDNCFLNIHSIVIQIDLQNFLLCGIYFTYSILDP